MEFAIMRTILLLAAFGLSVTPSANAGCLRNLFRGRQAAQACAPAQYRPTFAYPQVQGRQGFAPRPAYIAAPAPVQQSPCAGGACPVR